jgi:DNA-directed RNA polymerase specialized sigma24 family protein
VSSMADDLVEVIADCQTGDNNAQRRLYEHYHRRVYRLAVRMVGISEASDITQEIFLRVFARISSFRGKAAFSTWLYRVAVNECLRHLSRHSPRLHPLADRPVFWNKPTCWNRRCSSWIPSSEPCSCSVRRRGLATERSRRC